MFPEYNLKDKSLTYLNGSMFATTCKNAGKNGIGITPPDSMSATAIKMFVTPFSFNVLSVNTWYKVLIDVIKSTPTNKVIKNIMKCINDKGRLRPYG